MRKNTKNVEKIKEEKELIKDIDEVFIAFNKISNVIKKDKTFGFNLPRNDFYKAIKLYLTPQSYGSRIENRSIMDYGFIKISSKLDKGDAIYTNIKEEIVNIEIKASYNATDRKFNYVQIRPYQHCDWYLLHAIDYYDGFKSYDFLIHSSEIVSVLIKFNACNCHGVSVNKKDTSNEEMRFSILQFSENWDYLMSNFYCEDVLKKLNM